MEHREATVTPLTEIHSLKAEEWEAYREIRLRSLSQDPEAFGSTFEKENAFPADFWQTRVADGARLPHAHPIVARTGDAWVGLSWGWIHPDEPTIAHLFQMWVAPEARGRGVARMLVDSVIEWARVRGAAKLLLGVTVGDTPARRLYERVGFVPDGSPIPLRPGGELLEQPMVLRLEPTDRLPRSRS
ncbi:MAG: GNAT family N-acetyltransferase [Candidatus Eisenbacteria bacterium]|uniref:GNAT family N-acetyltransferase n=1 Tax=Eiseniibacteriota bacterium TaxID=2212470 RepID=A0A956NF73_UNCEI|nr:GNAT family N-acetyltransferase [Candidatus Eisenbacteria bacterium]MCB9466294.1 GNAT family N-acetyltransferase [Candidatus Eisenbacteria bacterium]